MEDDDESKIHIIIDNGSCYIKAGYSGEADPRTIFPSIVGYPKYDMVIHGGNKKNFFVGESAEYNRGILKLNYPIEHGVIKNWEEMEIIWGYIFTIELHVAPEDHNIMITECSKYPKENKEKNGWNNVWNI